MRDVFPFEKFISLQQRICHLQEIDEAIHNGILHAFKHMARNKHKKVFRAIQLVVLMKILCIIIFVCSNCQSDMKPLNVNHVTDYNLGLLILFNPLFIGFFGGISILKNVEKSVNNLLIIDGG